MNVTNTGAIVYNPAHYAKPRNAVRGGAAGGHDYAESSRQVERLDRGDGAGSAGCYGGGRARRKCARDCADGRGSRILRGGRHVSAQHGGDEGFGCGAAGAGGAGWGGFRLWLGQWQRAGGLSEEVFVFSGDEQAGDCGDQRSGGGIRTRDRAVLRFAFRFGRGAIQHGVCAAWIDCRIWDGVDAAAVGGTCKRAGFIVFGAID